MSDTTYTITSSQPLTQQQIDYLNSCLENLPSSHPDFEDVPEYMFKFSPFIVTTFELIDESLYWYVV